MPAVPLLPPVAVVPVLPPLLLLPPVAVVPVSLLLLLLPQPNEAERRQTMTNMPSFFMYSPSPYERAIPKWTFMTQGTWHRFSGAGEVGSDRRIRLMHLGTLCQGRDRLGVLTMLGNLIIFLPPWSTSTRHCFIL